MSSVGQPERATQNRVIALFRDELGYRYLGDWTDRDGNSNIEEGLLSAWLTKGGYTPAQIGAALYKLRTEADNHSRTLYGNNQAVYSLLRYGVPVKTEAGKVTETVHLINWQEPEQERLRHRRGGDAQGQPRAAAGPRAVRERHRHRRAGAEEQPRQHRRRHPPEPLQPAARVQRLVLQHGAVHLRRQRLRGAAIRRHRHAGEVLPQVEGRRSGQQPLQAGQVPAQDVPQRPADRADARLRAVRRRR